MKKLFFLFALCALAVSCTPKSVVNGTFSDENVPEESVMVIVADPAANTADTCEISGGKFHFECPASDTTLLFARIAAKDESAPLEMRRTVSFVPTEGNITIDMNADPCTVEGSALTDALVKFQKSCEDTYDKYEKALENLSALFPEGTEMYKEMQESLQQQVRETIKKNGIITFKENTDNVVGMQALSAVMYDLSLQELDGLLEEASPYIKGQKRIQAVRAAKVQEQATSEGKMFVDFEGKTPDGEVVRLSDYVGRGKYVLVDFWASWCGPCRREIPNIKELYEKYSSKDLVVLGVAVWDKDNSASRQVMEQLGMEWNQIFVGEDKTPTDSYGIVAIPHIILFAPDGTVAKRGLRGDEMKDTVAKLFE